MGKLGVTDDVRERACGTSAGRRRLPAGIRRRACAVALLLAAWPPLAWVGALWLIVGAELPRANALVVLSGSANYVERAGTAARLFHEGRAPRVILTDDNLRSGWSDEERRNPFFFERATAELRQAGVPADKIMLAPGPVSGTYDEALRLREYAAANKLDSLLVVTSAYHSRRALWTLHDVFRGTGINLGLVVVAPGGQTPRPTTWWLQPRGWQMVAAEYPKLIYYWWLASARDSHRVRDNRAN